MFILWLLLLHFTALMAFTLQLPHRHSLAVLAFKENEREEQMRLQQEILSRRKNRSKMQEYFRGVDQKREDTSKKMSQNVWAKTKDDVDPLEGWKMAKDKGDVKKIGYEAPPPSRLGFSIPIPVNPIGIERYDEGERFDLRLPYAERGYEDPEADVMGKIGRAFGGLFGRSKKEDPKATEKGEKQSSKGK